MHSVAGDLQIKTVAVDSLKEDPRNPRRHPEGNIVAIKDSLERFGQVEPLVVRSGTGIVVGGNGRLQAMREMGWSEARVVEIDLTDKQAASLGVALNRTGELAEWDADVLQGVLDDLGTADIDLEALSLSGTDLDSLMVEVSNPASDSKYSDRYTDPPGSMQEDFGAPPFSVLDTRKGYWQARKEEWRALGFLDPVAGREEASIPGSRGNTVPGSDWNLMVDVNSGMSIMDPVLCELLYAWFCPPGGQVVNPTAGESVYGVVAGVMGLPYYGIELRQEQIDVNRAHVEGAGSAVQVAPEWVQGNGVDVMDMAPDADFVTCCPPYYNLEEYSDLPEDLSHAESYEKFLQDYKKIITGCSVVLKPDRFAAFVVGDIRGEGGLYRGFVADTIKAFQDADMALYNDAILVGGMGTLHLRAGRHFRDSRKLGKAHQNVLVFVKGDPHRANEACGQVTRVDLGTKGEGV